MVPILCRGARARDRPHRRQANRGANSVPTVVFDYGFMGAEGEAETTPILVVRDVDSKMLFSHVVQRKGLIADHGVRQLVRDIERLGYHKVCLKCDGEPALTSMQHEVVKRRQFDTILENSPVGDSQSNGIAERAVQSVAQQIRVMRHSLQQKMGAVLPGPHPVTCWLVEHASDLLNKYQLGEDGRTAYQRLRGKVWSRDVVEFGEKVHDRMNLKNLPREQKLEPRWEEGFFLGVKLAHRRMLDRDPHWRSKSQRHPSRWGSPAMGRSGATWCEGGTLGSRAKGCTSGGGACHMARSQFAREA